ncbi:MAG: VTC domain-containing protein [Candidatus Neomarinimicrobiota bacterium]|nr:VTC domain-containing protein [Candidatus Neomarinimicrobiota bacterium]
MSFRKEEKLRINKNQLFNLLDWVDNNGGYKLFDSRIVSSTYFDNDELRMFKDSEEGSVPRKKIRIRSYSRRDHTQENSSLEVKISSVEGRYKTRTKLFNLKEFLHMGILDKDYGICKPRVRVTYKRSYIKIHNVRLTIDQDIEYIQVSNKKESFFKNLDSEIVIEVKANNQVSIGYLSKMFPFERLKFSKYSRAMRSIS